MGIGAGITQRSSTNELGLGTTRVTRHVPGYSGFIAEAPHNIDALSASDGVVARTDEKKRMLLASVDQYYRGVVPGYTGWRPQEPVNYRQFPGAIEPSRRDTTNGELNYQSQRYPYGHMKAVSMKPEVVGGDTGASWGSSPRGRKRNPRKGSTRLSSFTRTRGLSRAPLPVPPTFHRQRRCAEQSSRSSVSIVAMYCTNLVRPAITRRCSRQVRTPPAKGCCPRWVPPNRLRFPP